MTYQEYWTRIASIARDILIRCRESGEDLRDVTIEEVESTDWAIYTHYAYGILQHTENDDALFDMGCDLSPYDSTTAILSALAVAAMIEDAYERAGRGFDDLPEEAEATEEAEAEEVEA